MSSKTLSTHGKKACWLEKMKEEQGIHMREEEEACMVMWHHHSGG